MKNSSLFLFILLPSCHIHLSCYSQQYKHFMQDRPEKLYSFYKYRPLIDIAWSKDGKKFAYGILALNYNVNNYCKIAVIILDLVHDSIMYHFERDWTQFNPDDYFPGTKIEAYGIVLDQIYDELKKWETEVLPDKPAEGNIIKTSNDRLTVKIEKTDSPGEYSREYTIRVVSDNLGEKTISDGDLPFSREIGMEGSILSPDQSRVAMILKVSGGAEYDDEYSIIGCHLGAGFHATMK